MNEAEKYADVLTRETGDTWYREQVRYAVRNAYDAGHAAALASVTVPAEPITTAAELNALPLYAVVQRTDTAWQKCRDGYWRSPFATRLDPHLLIETLGPLTLLAPASPPVPAPVLLTADDPRWRDGAKVRGEFADGSAIEGVVRGWLVEVDLTGYPFNWDRPGRRDGNERFAAAYLIAEAPDPDADKRLVLRQALADARLHDWSDAELDDILHGLDGRNYDLTWRADS